MLSGFQFVLKVFSGVKGNQLWHTMLHGAGTGALSC